MRPFRQWTALVVVGVGAAWVLSAVAMGSGPASAGAAPATETVSDNRLTCDGDGSTGRRVRALYVRGDEQPDRYDAVSAKLQHIAARIDAAIAEAGGRTGGVRHVRFVHDEECVAAVDDVVIPQAEMADPERITAALRVLGYERPDRKYLYWYDAAGCGAALGAKGDDRPGPDNAYNSGPSYAGLGTGCWSWQASARELLRVLGAVQASAPHATGRGYCWGGRDILCLGGVGARSVPGHEPERCGRSDAIDCNADDYFNASPPEGSYLSSHWNVARSEFLFSD